MAINLQSCLCHPISRVPLFAACCVHDISKEKISLWPRPQFYYFTLTYVFRKQIHIHVMKIIIYIYIIYTYIKLCIYIYTHMISPRFMPFSYWCQARRQFSGMREVIPKSWRHLIGDRWGINHSHGGTPSYGRFISWFIIENPIEKWMTWWYPHGYGNLHIDTRITMRVQMDKSI